MSRIIVWLCTFLLFAASAFGQAPPASSQTIAEFRAKLPSKLPLPIPKIRMNTTVPYRYMCNYCTYGYTMPWWSWEQWGKAYFLIFSTLYRSFKPIVQKKLYFCSNMCHNYSYKRANLNIELITETETFRTI